MRAWRTALSTRDAREASGRQFAAQALQELRRRVPRYGKVPPTQTDEEPQEVRKTAKPTGAPGETEDY